MNTRKFEELPRRQVIVNGEVLSAPRHIVRIDIVGTPSKPKKVHGWQVRYQQQSKYFSDTLTPEKSLAQAEAFLQSIYKGPPSPFNANEQDNKSQKLGEVGIRLTHRVLTGRLYEDYRRKKTNSKTILHIEVTHPMKGMPSQRLLIGERSKVSDEKIEEQMSKARLLREQMKSEFLEFRKAIPAWSEKSTVENYRKFQMKRANSAANA